MSSKSQTYDTLDVEAVLNFQEYLRIPSVHPNINYDDCVKFLKRQARHLELPARVLEVVKGKPVIIITWLGTNPLLPTVMLNSHMDVVPVYEQEWTTDPFGANVDRNGNIYARGAQDMKSVGIQYLEAIRRLKCDGVTLKRTIHVTFVPDEEVGGADGMEKFVASQAFKDMNVGVVYDESMTSEDDDFILFYGEKSIWHFHIHCPGTPGHGASLTDNTAAEKIQCVLNKLLYFREEVKEKLDNNPSVTISDVISINLTQLKGGVQSNVIPPEYTAVFDCRLPATVDFDEWERTLKEWCLEAGDDVRIEYELKQPPAAITKLDADNEEWQALKEVAHEIGIKLKTMICPGSTDAKYIRRVGIPAFGFSPINNTNRLLHSHDEYLNISTFIKGIGIYYNIIEKIGNLQY